MPPVFTIGHSTRSSDDLLALLAEHRIEVLADVRRYPGSRRHPQFSRDALASALAEASIEYMHEPDLGGRRETRPGSPHVAWRVAAFRGYADHLETPEAQAALDRLIELSAERRTVILCAEAVPWRCHRRLISDALVARGIEVRHILSESRVDLHEVDPKARIENEGRRLIYDRGIPPETTQRRLFGDDEP